MRENDIPTQAQKNILALALTFSFLLCVVFYLLGCSAGKGTLAPAEADTMIYMQYAKSIAEGHAYVFSPGDAPSTGSTSHLYPFLLAAFYKLGATGNHLLVAGFILNSLFYLGSIICVWIFTRRFFPEALPLSLTLTVLSGQLASSVLGLTDMGYLTLITLSIFTAAICRRFWLFAGLLVLCSLSRPEGFIFSFLSFSGALGAMLIHKLFPKLEPMGDRREWTAFMRAGFLGLATYASTLLLNYYLTGYFPFMSVANKGYFNAYPFFGALMHTVHATVSIFKGYFFGLTGEARELYALPVVAALLGVAGILLMPRDKKKRFTELIFGLSVATAVILIASSQWQGISNDRYLAWITPFWLLYIAAGVYLIDRRVKAPFFKPLICTILVLFQLATLTAFSAKYYTWTAGHHQIRSFVKTVNRELPAGQRIGAIGGTGWLYYMPNHHLSNLSGITSPQFFSSEKTQSPLPSVENLKHNPENRFGYWLLFASNIQQGPWLEPYLGKTVLSDTDSFNIADRHTLYETCWDTLENGNTPQLISNQLDHVTLIGELDIGYLDHHTQYNYKTYCRLNNTQLPYVQYTDNLAGRDFSEIGLLIMGNETFSPQIDPDKDLQIVLRTASSIDTSVVNGARVKNSAVVTMNSPLKLIVLVDGIDIPQPAFELNDDGFSEILITIPASQLQQSNPKITIGGDHISFAYWFYQ